MDLPRLKAAGARTRKAPQLSGEPACRRTPWSAELGAGDPYNVAENQVIGEGGVSKVFLLASRRALTVMTDIEVVTTSERHDLEKDAEAAFRPTWPEFIFHDPVSDEYIKRVELYFPYYDVMLLEDGKVVAGAWGVQIGRAHV